MKRNISKIGCVFRFLAINAIFFCTTSQILAAFEVVCDLVAKNMRVNENMVVCGDLTVCGNLCARIPGVNIECAEIIFTSSDFGFTTCATENLTLAQVWNRNAYEMCPLAEPRFSEIRGVPLMTKDVAEERANRSIPTIPYLDFRIPTDLDRDGGIMEIDVHFFTMCRDSEPTALPGPDENLIVNSGPFCTGVTPPPSSVEITMLADFISDGQPIGANLCGEIQVTAQRTGVEVSTFDGFFNQYKLTFCIPAAEVLANINPCDWGRLMWFRTGSPIADDYEYTVFLGLAAVRYPKMILPCRQTCP